MKAVVVALLAMGMTLVVPAGALPNGTEFYNQSNELEVLCKDGTQPGEYDGRDAAGWITFNGPTALWPPNHKYSDVPITITATDEDSGDDVDLVIEATHNQYEGDTEWNGSGHTGDDVTPAGWTGGDTGVVTSVPFQVRSERSGRDQDGRVYRFSVEATFSDSQTDFSSEPETVCATNFYIYVPHDMRPSSRDLPDDPASYF